MDLTEASIMTDRTAEKELALGIEKMEKERKIFRDRIHELEDELF